MTLPLSIPEPVEPVPVTPKLTERDVLDALGAHYLQHGNGPRYVHAEHVRSHAGFDARRTADLIAMDLWPSKGLALIGHEVKVSRSDWLAELHDPSKADEFRRYMDRWYLVAPPGVVRDDLPDGWGLMLVAYGQRGWSVRVHRPAPKLAPEPVPKTMLASLLRATAKTSVGKPRCWRCGAAS